MFGNKKTLDIGAQVETLIGPGISVKGSLNSTGALRLTDSLMEILPQPQTLLSVNRVALRRL